MRVLSWLRSLVGSSSTRRPTTSAPTAPSTPSPTVPEFPDGWGALGGVGESQYQPALIRIAKSGGVCWAALKPEPDNPFDPNAVCVQVQGETVA